MEKKIIYTGYTDGLSFHLNRATDEIEFAIALPACITSDDFPKTVKKTEKTKEHISKLPVIREKHDSSVSEQMHGLKFLAEHRNTITTEYFTKIILNSFLVISCNENF
jgi:hypothetical protein